MPHEVTVPVPSARLPAIVQRTNVTFDEPLTRTPPPIPPSPGFTELQELPTNSQSTSVTSPAMARPPPREPDVLDSATFWTNRQRVNVEVPLMMAPPPTAEKKLAGSPATLPSKTQSVRAT